DWLFLVYTITLHWKRTLFCVVSHITNPCFSLGWARPAARQNARIRSGLHKSINIVQLDQHFHAVRQRTLQLARPLGEADMTIQAAAFASPGKWHLAHTSWFFEEFLLKRQPGYQPCCEAYGFLFNSYYEGVGARHAQAQRGLISRPGLAEVVAYRQN